MSFIEAESRCSHDDITDVYSALTGTNVVVEDILHFSNGCRRKDRVLASYVLGKDLFEFFLGVYLLVGHSKISYNLINMILPYLQVYYRSQDLFDSV